MQEAFGMGAPPIGSAEQMRQRAVTDPPNPATRPGEVLPPVNDPRRPEFKPLLPPKPPAMTSSIIGSPEKFNRRTVPRR